MNKQESVENRLEKSNSLSEQRTFSRERTVEHKNSRKYTTLEYNNCLKLRSRATKRIRLMSGELPSIDRRAVRFAGNSLGIGR